MAQAAIKIGASMSEYQSAMRQAVASMKNLSSEYSLAAANAKLYGTQSDVLQAKVKELAQKMEVQRQVVMNNQTQTETLRKKLQGAENAHGGLKEKVDDLKTAYEQSKQVTGEDSEETKNLKDQLNKAEAQLVKNEKQTEKYKTSIKNQEAATTQSKAVLAQMEVQLRDVNKELEKQQFGESAEKTENYNKTIEKCTAEMNRLTAEQQLATATAKLHGTRTDELQAKVTELSGKMDVQKTAVKSNEEQSKNLEETLDKLQNRHRELCQKVEDTEAAYKESCDATGENSEQSIKLKEQLNVLKAQLDTNEQAIGEQEKALNNQKTATIEAEAALEDLEVQLRNVNEELARQAFDEYASKAEKVGTAVENAGNKMLTVTGAITGVATASVTTATEFEAQMSKVEAVSGATEKELEQLQEQAVQLGSDTAFSAKEAAQGMENLASSGFTVEEIMEAMPGMLDLAASSGEDLSTSADIAASTLRGFGLEASKATHVADVLAKNAADTNAAVADTGEAMKYVAPVANAMGISFEECAVAIGIMADSGIKGSQAGTTLRGALSRLSKPTESMAKVMKRLGLDFFDSEGKMISLSEMTGMLQSKMAGLTEEERNQALITIFGQESLSGMLSLMQAGQTKIDSLTESYENCDGAAADMAATMQDNLQGKVDEFTSKIEAVSITVGNMLIPTVEKAVEKLTGIAEKFLSMDESTQKTIMTVGAAVAAIGPLLLIIGKMITFSGKVSSGLGTLSATLAKAGFGAANAGASTGAFSTILAAITSPVGIAIAAVTALVSSMAYVAFTNKDVKESLLQVWETFQSNLQPVIEYISGTVLPDLKGAWESMLEMLQPIKDFIVGALTSAWQDILIPILEWLAGTVLPNLLTTFQNLWENVLVPLGEFVGNILKPAFAFLAEILDELWNTVLVPLAQFITGTLMDAWEGVYTIINTTVIPVMEKLLNSLEWLWNNILEPFTQWLSATLKPIFQTVFETLGGTIETAKTNISNAVTSIKETMAEIFESVKSNATEIWENIKSSITKPITDARDTVGDIIENIKKKFNFEWSLPKLKMPHFQISGSFSINPPSVPSFNIEWYKNGGIMTHPTAFGMNGNSVMVGGEAGAEAILPLAQFYTELGNMIDKKLDAIASKNVTYVYVTLDGDEISTKTAARIENKIVKDILKKR